MQSIVLLEEDFKTQIVSEVFVRFSNSLGSYPEASRLWNPPPHEPPLRNDVIVYQRKGEMRQREGSQKTNLEQKYLFSFIRFQRWQIWRYRKNMTASWKSNVHPFKLCHQRGMKTCQLQFYIFSSLPHAQYRSGQARVGA